MNYCPNYLVNVHIFVSNQEKMSLNFVVELLSFKILFFPSAITGWNSLDLVVRNSVSPPTLKAKNSVNYRLSDYSFYKACIL